MNFFTGDSVLSCDAIIYQRHFFIGDVKQIAINLTGPAFNVVKPGTERN